MSTITVEYPNDWTEYELLDSGHGEKLERFGSYILVRPDPRAIWEKTLPEDTWQKADAIFQRLNPNSGEWEIKSPPPSPWRMRYKNLIFTLRPTEFKHVGIFPEQAVNWNWLTKIIAGRPLNILNLFAYTGGATMAALAAGAKVTHLDAAKSTLTWANENLQASGLSNKPVRWIEDDALKFVLRERKRGNTYDGIIMDPPRFGRGSKGEVWKLENDLAMLTHACGEILTKNPVFILVNAYTADISSIALDRLVADMTKKYHGTQSFGELALKETSSEKLLPNGIFTRWSSE
jgi:23S rRNA (cytosine1962-C5)-methyltransferase